MSGVTELLARLDEQGVRLWIEGDRLRFSAPPGVLSGELRERLVAAKSDVMTALRARSGVRRAAFPLSYNQRALWFLHEAAPQATAYNVAFAMEVRSAVNLQALRDALQALVDRHPALRTTFSAGSAGVMQEVHEAESVAFEHVDASSLSVERLHALVVNSHSAPFDLEHGPLFRAALFTRAPERHVLLISAHHIATDGWSIWILLDELRTLYSARVRNVSTPIPRPAADYQDFVKWQLELLGGAEGERLWAYWRRELSGEILPLDVPFDKPRPPVQTFAGGSREMPLDAALVAGLRDVARSEGTTLYTILLSAFHALLRRYSRQPRVIVGSPTFGRGRAEFQSIIGDFIGVVPVKADFVPKLTFRLLLQQVRDTVHQALAHQDFPFPLLVERLQIPRDPSRSPVFQASFVYQKPQRASDLTALFVPGESAAVEFGDLLVTAYSLPQQEGQFDLTLEVAEIGDAAGTRLKYNVDLFERETIERMLGHYELLLRAMVENPDVAVDAVPLMTPDESARLRAWNATASPFDAHEGVERMFEAQVDRAPAQVAVACEGRSLTYGDLESRANQVAAFLRAQGVGRNHLVGVSVQRTPDLLVAVLGVLKSGGAYVPLDPAFPAQRLALMVEDSQLGLILTDTESEGSLPESDAVRIRLDADWSRIAAYAPDRTPSAAGADDLAYVLYTSGSTGKPKGVQVPRRALTNFIRSMQRSPGIDPTDRLLAVTTLSFDIAGLELYLPLSVGARVVLATRDQANDAAELRTLLESSGATMMQGTPATWRMLIDSGWQGTPALKILCGGEALPRELAAQLHARAGSVWNMYGPTETTIWSTVERLEPDGRISIGRPIANTRVYVVDEELRPTPVGVPGELCIAGEGVARGYLGRPDLTGEKFVADPFSPEPGARMYRTGDVARWLPDGRIDCLGRLDQQVKVRGFRIELMEIEAALERHEAVREAVASVCGDDAADRRLVAYVVYEQGADVTVSELRRFLRRDLPEYMIPALLVTMDAMPLTPNGKVDRRALPPPMVQQRRHAERVAPRTQMEQLVAEVWSELLGAREISVHDNFFDIGGHSLLSVQAIARLEKLLGVRLNPARFVMDTLEQISAACEQMAAPGVAERTPAAPGLGA